MTVIDTEPEPSVVPEIQTVTMAMLFETLRRGWKDFTYYRKFFGDVAVFNHRYGAADCVSCAWSLCFLCLVTWHLYRLALVDPE